jgi:hypothetical protein
MIDRHGKHWSELVHSKSSWKCKRSGHEPDELIVFDNLDGLRKHQVARHPEVDSSPSREEQGCSNCIPADDLVTGRSEIEVQLPRPSNICPLCCNDPSMGPQKKPKKGLSKESRGFKARNQTAVDRLPTSNVESDAVQNREKRVAFDESAGPEKDSEHTEAQSEGSGGNIMDQEKENKAMQIHIAMHLRSLAFLTLRFLPENLETSNNGDDGSSNATSIKATDATRSTIWTESLGDQEGQPITPTESVQDHATEEKFESLPGDATLPDIVEEVKIDWHDIGVHHHTPRLFKADTLGDMLRQNAHCYLTGQKFWPLSLVREILSEDRVSAELSQYFAEDDAAKYKSYILGFQNTDSYLRIFAILLLLGKGKDIEIFVRNEYSDDALPLPSWFSSKVGHSSSDNIELPRVFSHWKEEESEAFLEAQQGFIESLFEDPLTLSSPVDASHELQTAIFDALEQTEHSQSKQVGLGFLSRTQLRRLVNPRSVYREFMRINYSTAEDAHQIKLRSMSLALQVCNETVIIHRGKPKLKSFRKMFALLVLVEATSTISQLLEENVSDMDLPLSLQRSGATFELRRRDSSSQPSEEPLKCFSHHTWSPTKIKNFEAYQWCMLAPFFSQDEISDVKHYSLDARHILPYVDTADGDDNEYLGGSVPRSTTLTAGDTDNDLLFDLRISSRESLASRILASFQSSTFDTRTPDFLPADLIEQLVTREIIREELELEEAERRYNLDTARQVRLVDWILAEAKTVFAITVTCGRNAVDTLMTMNRFQRFNFNDARLPVDDPRTTKNLVAHSSLTPEYFDSRIWSKFALYDFYEKQWKFIAPIFGPSRYIYDLSSDAILPFFLAGDVPKMGAFSSVYQVKIHPAHLKHHNLRYVSYCNLSTIVQDSCYS